MQQGRGARGGHNGKDKKTTEQYKPDVKQVLESLGFAVDPRHLHELIEIPDSVRDLRKQLGLNEPQVKDAAHFNFRLTTGHDNSEASASSKQQKQRQQQPAQPLEASTAATAALEPDDKDSAASEVLRAALAALQAESPVMYKQIQAVSNETLAAQRDRTRALNAKGVFSAHINEVRSRTQTRVELSNRIAAASSKLLEKMVKEAMMVQASSLLMKIERIHSLLLDSYAERMKEDVSSAAAARAAAAGMVQSGSAALSKLKGAVGSMTGLAAPGATAAVAAAGKAPSGQTRASNTSIAWAKPEAGGVTSRSMESDVSVRIDWDNVPLEVVEAKLAAIETAQGEAIARYHRSVQQQQVKLLAATGMLADEPPAGSTPGSGSSTPARLEEAINELESKLQDASLQKPRPDAAAMGDDVAALERASRRRRAELEKTRSFITLVAMANEQLGERRRELGMAEAPTVQERRKTGAPPPRRGGLASQMSVRFADGKPSSSSSLLPLADTSSASFGSGRGSGLVGEKSATPPLHGEHSGVGHSRGRVQRQASFRPPTAEDLRYLQPSDEFPAMVAQAASLVPQLPPVRAPPGASHHVIAQVRLERTWAALQMPRSERIAQVERYLSIGKLSQFDRALELWERCAAAVVYREQLLEELVAAQQLLEAGEAELLAEVEPDVERLCAVFLGISTVAEHAACALRAETGDVLTYQGQPYLSVMHVGETEILQLIAHVKATIQLARATGSLAMSGAEPDGPAGGSDTGGGGGDSPQASSATLGASPSARSAPTSGSPLAPQPSVTLMPRHQ